MNREFAFSLEQEPTSGVLYCQASEGSADLTYVQATIYDALIFLKGLHFDVPLPWTEKSLYDWFRTGIDGIVTEVSATDWRAGYLKRGTVYIVYRPVIYPTEPMTVAALPFSLLVHEARHTDPMTAHTCNETADQRVDEMRAFGVQYYLYRWIAEHSDATPHTKAWAAWMAWEVRANKTAFCAECDRASAAVAAVVEVSVSPHPVLATPIAGSDKWKAEVTFRALETAGVDVTISRIEYTVSDTNTGATLNVMPLVMEFAQRIPAWGSFSYPQIVVYRPIDMGHDAILSTLVTGVDARGNQLTRRITTEIH